MSFEMVNVEICMWFFYDFRERSPRPARPHPSRRVELADSVSTRECERLVQPVASSWSDSSAFTCVCLPGSDPVRSSRRPARPRAGRTAVTPTSSVAGSHWGFKLNRLGYVTLRGRQLAPHPPTRQPPLKCSGSTFPSQQGQKTCWGRTTLLSHSQILTPVARGP